MPAFCTAYENGSSTAVTLASLPQYLQTHPDAFVWVSLPEPDAAEIERCAKLFSLHELAVEDAQKGRQRPKIEEYGDTLFVVLRPLAPPVPSDDSDEPFRPGQISVFCGKRYVFVVCRDATYPVEQVASRVRTNPALLAKGSGFLLYNIIDTVVDSYFPVVEALEDKLDEMEDRIFLDKQTRESLKTFYESKEKLIAAKHAVTPLMEALGRMSGGRVPPLLENFTDYYRDIADHLVRLNSILDTTREMLQTTLQVGLTLEGLAESETTKKLAAWAAMIALPTMIAGFYGMNFEALPGLHWAWGWVFCTGAMIAVDAALFWKFKKTGWM